MPPMWAPPLILALLGIANAGSDFTASGARSDEGKDWRRALCNTVVDISQERLDFTLRSGFIPPPEEDAWNTIYEQHLPLEAGKGWYRISVWYQVSLTDSRWSFCYLYFHRGDNKMQWNHPFGKAHRPPGWLAQDSANALCQAMQFDGASHYFQSEPASGVVQGASSSAAAPMGSSQTQTAAGKADPWAKADPWSKNSSWAHASSSFD